MPKKVSSVWKQAALMGIRQVLFRVWSKVLGQSLILAPGVRGFETD